MPVTGTSKLQVYVDTFDTELGPVVDAQAVTPVTPVIDQVPVPVGALTPEGPATVAVKVIVDPSTAVLALALTVIVGEVVVTDVV